MVVGGWTKQNSTASEEQIPRSPRRPHNDNPSDNVSSSGFAFIARCEGHSWLRSVAALLALAMASYFWVDSRYPHLVKKLHSGKAIAVKGAISFDALLPVKPDMPLAVRAGCTTVNWMWTNRIGMMFVIGFRAAMLTLLPLLPRRRFKSAAGNTLFGALLGTPLGVCANCVALIGLGLAESGASRQTVVATMFSSPLLNVVVLAMAFTLFPLPVALTRLAVPLVLLALVTLIPVKKTGLA